MNAPHISCSAFVRQPHGAWRDSEIQVIELSASMLVDYSITTDGIGNTYRLPAWHGLMIDGSQCVRFRLPDGRMCAVTLVFARCGT